MQRHTWAPGTKWKQQLQVATLFVTECRAASSNRFFSPSARNQGLGWLPPLRLPSAPLPPSHLDHWSLNKIQKQQHQQPYFERKNKPLFSFWKRGTYFPTQASRQWVLSEDTWALERGKFLDLFLCFPLVSFNSCPLSILGFFVSPILWQLFSHIAEGVKVPS